MNFDNFQSASMWSFYSSFTDFKFRVCLQFQLDRTLIWNAEENFFQESFKGQVTHGIPSKEAAYILCSDPNVVK